MDDQPFFQRLSLPPFRFATSEGPAALATQCPLDSLSAPQPMTGSAEALPRQMAPADAPAAPFRAAEAVPTAEQELQRVVGAQPVSRREMTLAGTAAGLLVAIAAVLLPLARLHWQVVPGFIVAYSTGSIILDVLVVILLVSRYQIDRDGSSLYLATAYVYAVLVTIPYMASFPDSLRPGNWIGMPGSAAWLWACWHIGFAGLIIRYGCTPPNSVSPKPFQSLLLAAMLAGLVAWVSLIKANDLPQVLIGRHYFPGPVGRLTMGTVIISNLAAVAALGNRLRRRNSEDLWLAVGMVGASVDAWLSLRGAERYSLGWYCGRTCGLSTTFVVFVSLMTDVLRTYQRVAAANDILDRMSLTDPLTKLGNRRIFDSTLNNEWRRCRRDKLPLSVILFDVDEFKSYNDTYGHQAGDLCLERIAGRLRDAAARGGDLATRYGGEEFALILPATSGDGASYVANIVRLTIRDDAIAHAASAHGVITISAGVATVVPSDSFAAGELVRLADQALYRAKAAGRNHVVIAG